VLSLRLHVLFLLHPALVWVIGTAVPLPQSLTLVLSLGRTLVADLRVIRSVPSFLLILRHILHTILTLTQSRTQIVCVMRLPRSLTSLVITDRKVLDELHLCYGCGGNHRRSECTYRSAFLAYFGVSYDALQREVRSLRPNPSSSRP
jgi:hypothetical protein